MRLKLDLHTVPFQRKLQREREYSADVCNVRRQRACVVRCYAGAVDHRHRFHGLLVARREWWRVSRERRNVGVGQQHDQRARQHLLCCNLTPTSLIPCPAVETGIKVPFADILQRIEHRLRLIAVANHVAWLKPTFEVFLACVCFAASDAGFRRAFPQLSNVQTSAVVVNHLDRLLATDVFDADAPFFRQPTCFRVLVRGEVPGKLRKERTVVNKRLSGVVTEKGWAWRGWRFPLAVGQPAPPPTAAALKLCNNCRLAGRGGDQLVSLLFFQKEGWNRNVAARVIHVVSIVVCHSHGVWCTALHIIRSPVRLELAATVACNNDGACACKFCVQCFHPKTATSPLHNSNVAVCKIGGKRSARIERHCKFCGTFQRCPILRTKLCVFRFVELALSSITINPRRCPVQNWADQRCCCSSARRGGGASGIGH